MRLLLSFIFILTVFTSLGQKQNWVPGELLIQMRAGANAHQFARTIESKEGIGINNINTLSEIVGIYQFQFTESAINLDQLTSVLNTYPQVQIVQKNHYITSRETIPTDEFFPNQWHLKNTGMDGGDVDADIDATDAWDITTGGLTTHNDTIVVCVIEGSGVDISHVDLQGNLWKNYAEIPDDGIDNDGNGYIDDFDGWNVQTEDDQVGSGSHGTRVSGMIGAKGNNGIGVSGVNWDVKMMIVKGQQASNEASVIAAYSYPLKMRKMYNESFGAEGAFVVVTNASWGLDNGDPEDSPLWCAMYDSLGAQGILSVGATTNNNVNVEESGDLPTNCTSPYFIGVTMSNNSDVRANSGYGTTSVDLAAPGSGVRLPVPGDLYSTTSGTSFAAPCVSGAVALAYSAPCAEFINLVKFDPPAAALQMREYIFDGVDPIVALSSEVATGGRLNINNSIGLMLGDCDEDACIPPYNMRVEAITDTSADIVWEGFTADYVLTITPAGGSPSVIPVEGATSLSFDTLTPCTNYTITIQANCEPELSEASFPINFTSDGCCINPPLADIEKTETSLTVSWPEVLYATQYNFRYSKIDEEDWTELEDVTAPLLIEDLEECTEYEFQIYTLCSDSTHGFSESTILRTKGCGACTELEYCVVAGANDNLEWIDTVKVNGAVKGTGANSGWLQSEEIITALTPGESYIFTIKPGFTGSSFTERYSIYIDFNQNGTFEIPEEQVLDDHSTLGTVNQMIFIPGDAELGVTKIRIGMSALSEPVPCPTSAFYGEYEDYCIYIGPQASIPENELILNLYPNPAQNELFVQANQDIEEIRIFANDGQLIHHESNFTGASIDISNFAQGIYLVQVQTNYGIITQKIIKQ